jgi:hypothetical protein
MLPSSLYETRGKSVDGKQIRAITPQGVVYLDDNGEEKFIDFAACYEKYVKRRTTPEHWEDFKKLNHKTDADWDWYVEWVKNWKEVGVHDAFGGLLGKGSPYIQFHTEPPTVFDFATQAELYKAQNAIREAGWGTFDLG